MGKQQKQLRLGAFLPGAGQHVAAWRHPQAQSNGALNFEHYKQIAQTAERGKFDAFFLADGLALQQRRGAEGRTAFGGDFRYIRAHEFIDVVKGLWDSWEDDAFVRDKETAFYYDPNKIHELNHKGRFFSVRGPLNIARPPQGYPVIVQAGSSEDGKELAGRTAEVIFTAQQTLEDAQAFYADVKGRLAKYGRTPDQLKVMPGVFPVVGITEAEAKAKYQELQDLIHPQVGLALLQGLIGTDLSSYPLDEPLPDLPETNDNKSRQALLIDIARKHNFTIRELYQWIAGARGHWTIIGTPVQIADQLESWFVNDAADGFNIMPPYLPGGLDDFVDLVIPELQRRGLFRTEYEGTTLRENLGLSRPVNQYQKVLAAV